MPGLLVFVFMLIVFLGIVFAIDDYKRSSRSYHPKKVEELPPMEVIREQWRQEKVAGAKRAWDMIEEIRDSSMRQVLRDELGPKLDGRYPQNSNWWPEWVQRFIDKEIDAEEEEELLAREAQRNEREAQRRAAEEERDRAETRRLQDAVDRGLDVCFDCKTINPSRCGDCGRCTADCNWSCAQCGRCGHCATSWGKFCSIHD